MDTRINWAVKRIETRLGAQLDVPALAASVNLSPSRFAYLFRRDLGTSPAQFVRARRLDRARELLETTFMSVKEVMVEVGFNDASHFTRDFRRHHGLTPRAWRQTRRSRPKDDSGAAPARARRGPCEFPPPGGTQRRGARGAAFESSATPERHGVRVGLGLGNPALQDRNAFSWRAALPALRANFVGSFRLVYVARPVAHQAAAAHLEHHPAQSA